MTSDPWTDIAKVYARIKSGIDPDRFRFITSPGNTPEVCDALVQAGVPIGSVQAYNIHESEVIEPGEVLVIDHHAISDPTKFAK